jgi:hypothetical protein
MILTSCLNNEKYIWVKIPRTATYAFKEIFLLYNESEEIHQHNSYLRLCNFYDVSYPGVTVVRHPLQRFISCIYYMHQRQKNTSSAIKNLWESTSSCITFLNTTFGKNCQTFSSFNDIFVDVDTQQTMSSCRALFKTQTHQVYNPKVTVFKYEELDFFKKWIEENLGYDLKNLKSINSSNYSIQLPVDFKSREFIETVENLFYDDYKVFGYPFQYLT